MTKVFGYAVKINQYCDHSETTQHGDGAYDYSWAVARPRSCFRYAPEESYSNSLHSVSKTDNHPDVTSIHDFKVADIAYLVWAEWSSGNSFGHGSRTSAEPFALLKEASDAFDLQNKLEVARCDNNTRKWEDTYRFDWKSSDGQIVESGFLPWLGYFESLDDVHVEEVIIQ